MDQNEKSEEPLYYMENGFMVFTEAFHLKRGYCCNNGCRHCPYRKKPDGGEKNEYKGDEDKTFE